MESSFFVNIFISVVSLLVMMFPSMVVMAIAGLVATTTNSPLPTTSVVATVTAFVTRFSDFSVVHFISSPFLDTKVANMKYLRNIWLKSL